MLQKRCGRELVQSPVDGANTKLRKPHCRLAERRSRGRERREADRGAKMLGICCIGFRGKPL